MKLGTFEIQLDNPTAHYFAGEMLRGSVTLDLVVDENEEVIFSPGTLTIRVKGKCKTSWQTGVEETRRKFREKEKYFDQQLPLYRKGQERMEIKMNPGERKYLFRYALPWDVPSSFEEKKGSVFYYVKAFVKGLEKEDIKVKKSFMVTAVVDLNGSSDALQPIELRKEKFVCCFCCKSGPIGFELRVPRTRFVSEETIFFDIEFFNMSRRIVSDMTVALFQIYTFRAKEIRPRTTVWVMKKNQNLLGIIYIPPLHPKETETYENRKLKLPADLPPTKLCGCNLIDVDYFLQAKMKINNSFTLEGKIPIFLGTVPLRNLEDYEDKEHYDNHPRQHHHHHHRDGNSESVPLDTEVDISTSDYMPLHNESKNSESVAPSEAAATTSQHDDETGSQDEDTRHSESTPLVDVEVIPTIHHIPGCPLAYESSKGPCLPSTHKGK